MVFWVRHLQMLLPAIVVLLNPLRAEPPRHYAFPAVSIVNAPPRRRLHVIK
jgi:hypothetical protein